MPSWDYSKMRNAGVQAVQTVCPSTPAAFELVAWYENRRTEDLPVNVALFGGTFLDSSGGEVWALVQLIRTPHESYLEKDSPFAELAEWHPYRRGSHSWSPIAVFENPPSASETEDFLQNWHVFSCEVDPTERGVLDSVWSQVLGGVPPVRIQEWQALENPFSAINKADFCN